jgi:hypothetical protein
VTKLEKTINDLRHQLIDTENKLKLSQLDQEKSNSINKNNSNQLNEKNHQIEQLQTRLIVIHFFSSFLSFKFFFE